MTIIVNGEALQDDPWPGQCLRTFLPRQLKGNLCRCTGYRAITDALAGHANTEKSGGTSDAGRSIGAPAGVRVVTGTEQYTMDHSPDGLLHMAVLRSPLPHARILSIDASAAERMPGVQLVLTHSDSPAVAFSTARHENRLDDPDDTYVLDDVVRFIGQRVAAVVADSAAIAENACRLIAVEYQALRAVFDPEAARSPGAPLVHGDKGADARIADVSRNVVAELHGGVGDVEGGLAAARNLGGVVVSGRWTTQRVQHAHLETHGCTGWREEHGRLVIRTSSQAPFLVRDELCHLFGLDRSQVHVFTRRVGGGFGGKKEMLTEDLVTLAVLRLGKPVRYEFSRTDEFGGCGGAGLSVRPPRVRAVWKFYGILGVAAALTAYLCDVDLPWSIAIGVLASAAPAFLAGVLRGAATPALDEDPAAALSEMSGTDFEDHVARIARRTGAPVIMTPLTGDWGVDLIVGRRPDRLAIQCKRQSRPVGAGAVQEVVAGAPMQDCTQTMVVTNHDFTPAARKLAELHGCVLVGGTELTRLGSTIRRLVTPDGVR